MRSTLCLIRQDPARVGLIRAVVICLATGCLMRVVPETGSALATLSVDDPPKGLTPMYLLFTALAATFVLAANAWTRSSRLALALPVPARRAWAVRSVWLAAVGLLSIASLAVTMGSSLDPVTGRLGLNTVIALAAARSAATVLLLAALYQLPQSRRGRIPIGPPYVVYLIFVSFFTLIISATETTSLTGTLVILAAAAAIGVYLYLRVPPTFSAGPTIDESDDPVWVMPDEEPGERKTSHAEKTQRAGHRHPRLWLHWMIFRSISSNLLTWFHLLLIGSATAVAVLEFFRGKNAILALFLIAVYALPLIRNAFGRMRPFDPLPVPRQTLWAHTVVPIVLVIALGAAFAVTRFAVNPLPFSQVHFNHHRVEVPLEHLVISRSARVPTMTAAWGESHTPTAHPLWPGTSIVLYNPFEAPAQSSARFVELQMRRGVEAVYGIPVPHHLRSPDHQVPSNIAGGVDRGAFTLAVTRGRPSADRSRSAAMAVLLMSVLGTAITLASMLRFGPSPYRRISTWVVRGWVAVAIAIAIAIGVAALMGMLELWYVGAVMSIAVRWFADRAGLSAPMLWSLCAVSWIGSYLLLARVFQRVEFPRDPATARFAEDD